MALTADRLPPETRYIDQSVGGVVIEYTVAASTTIYKGAFVRIDAGGDIEPCASTSTEPCLGVALEKADNSGGADGDIRCRVLVGAIIEHAITATVADIEAPVYTSDDETLTLTSTTNELLGVLIGIADTNTGIIKCMWPGTGLN